MKSFQEKSLSDHLSINIFDENQNSSTPGSIIPASSKKTILKKDTLKSSDKKSKDILFYQKIDELQE